MTHSDKKSTKKKKKKDRIHDHHPTDNSKEIKAIVPERYEDNNFVDTSKPVWNYSLLHETDISNFQQGTHYRLYEKFGSHVVRVNEQSGMYFAVWAPNATSVSVTGSFNDWKALEYELFPRWDKSGIWEGFIPGFTTGEVYKYHIVGFQGNETDKGDPFAHFWERKPKTSSKTWELDFDWNDSRWMKKRKKKNALDAPWSIYEVHLASWRRPDKHNEAYYFTYSQIAEKLVSYVKEMGFTHVELMPVMEHPFDGSWGYQGTGFFAPTSRFGTPQEFMKMIEAFHQEGIGVILDWVPSHFPYDAHGIFRFDGTHTYEYADMRKGYHPDWKSYIFNYKRGEVKSFLISCAMFWIDIFHADGLRVDAVSSMLKLSYSRKEGEWEPNELGGDANLEAIAFLKDLNETISSNFPDVQMIAEESTDWPGVSHSVVTGGLGFGMKWMMGWMHDTLRYFSTDPLFRPGQQEQFTFSMVYFKDEHFLLPLSHDEIVHGKSPMLYKMPGDSWQQFANLRLLYTYMFTHPGGKLLFMGNEFGSTSEWNYKSELPWELLENDSHKLLKDCVKEICHLYRNEPALYEKQFSIDGFEWQDLDHRDECVLSFRRKGNDPKEDLLIVLNMTPVIRWNWKIQVKGKSVWKEIFNSDLKKYWGTGDVFNPDIPITVLDKKQKFVELLVHLPPLGAIVLK